MWEFNATGGGSTSAVVDADIVYFGDRAGYFYALEIKTGKTKWRMKVGDTVCSDPILHGDIIFFGASDSDQHFLCAMKKENGEILWKSLSTNEIQCTPAVTDEIICFADIRGQVYAIDSRDGEEKWKFIPDRITKPMITTDLIVSDGVLYFGGAINTLYALDITSGALKWGYETDDKIRNNLVLDNGTIYFTDASYIHALDIHTHWRRWKTMLPTGIRSSITVTNGVAFVVSNDGLWAIDVGSGRAIWNKALWKDEPPYGVILPATGHLAVTKTAIYWSTGYHIYAIERE
jgi:outer membrane protein assembly factor BamB